MASANHARYKGFLRNGRMPRVVLANGHSAAPETDLAGAIEEAVRVLRGGGLVAFPTETVYGLGARALDERAIGRVFAAKGRPATHPLIAHVLDDAQARRLAASWPEQASALGSAFWPGPLTMVVERAPAVPAAVSGGGASIAVRAPAHAVARALIEALGEPIAAPSANRYQGLSPTTAAHVVKELGDAVDLVLDGGPCAAGIESTVVDLRGARPTVLRPGALDLGSLRRVVPSIASLADFPGSLVGPSVPGGEARPSPGMDARHYAPRATLRLADGAREAIAMAVELASAGARVGLVTRGARIGGLPAHTGVVVRALPQDPAAYARLLYGTLHDLDDAGVDSIVVERVPGGEAWWAVADRLYRAAALR